VTRKEQNEGVDEAPVIINYQDEFARIEREVDAGQTDLSDLGFWTMVRKVKMERRLADHWADVVGRIDRRAFEARVRPLFPVWLGNAVLVAATAVWIAAVLVAVALAREDPGTVLPGLLALAAAGGLSTTVHDLAHWLVGRAVGIRFTHYYFDGPLRIEPGLKIDYASYLRADPGERAGMHAAGAVASKLAPFAVFAGVYVPHAAGGWELFPEWSLWAILGIGVFQLFTDVLYSRKKSDWKKVRRERGVARGMRASAVGKRG
jgi:hypothetical protein